MTDYTPSTQEVKEWYADSIDRLGLDGEGEFDRWLNAERARIWEEGYDIGADLHLPASQHINPYRKVNHEPQISS